MSKARKAELKKSYREKERERKRFTLPLPLFLESKYPNIFEEYKELYNSLNVSHGKVRNLTKTYTFKKWKDDVERQRVETVCTTTRTSVIEDQVNEDQPTGTASRTAGTSVNEGQVSEDQATETPRAMAEIIIPANTGEDQATEEVIRMDINELADIMVNVEGQVENIVNELRQDPYLRNIMEGVEAEVETQADEGIDISPLDDIEFNIEPFDFDLEVGNYPW